jgi:hypothetical protein
MPQFNQGLPQVRDEEVTHRPWRATEPFLHHGRVKSWMREQPLPTLFLQSVCAVLIPSVIAVSIVVRLILHDHWTGIAVVLVTMGSIQTAIGVTIGERNRRRDSAAVRG